jgi:hypothetical protein
MWWIAAAVLVLAAVILFFAKENFFPTGRGDLALTTSIRGPDFQSLVGDWVRPDGGYIIRIRRVNPEGGGLDAGYFNPRPINVAVAVASAVEGKVSVFIKLEDKGYPGSTYKLVHNMEKDVLVGTYFQATLGQSFDVAFFRKK